MRAESLFDDMILNSAVLNCLQTNCASAAKVPRRQQNGTPEKNQTQRGG
jgi:hypothetical protein